MNMRKTMLAAAAALLAGSAFAGDADFTLVNRTGYPIREVYISAAHKNNWGRDRLGEGILENNKSRFFRFHDRASCSNDLKVVFDDNGTEVTWDEVDLCDLEKLTIRYDRRSKKVTAFKE